MSASTPKTVVPIIAVESVEEARRFYIETLGFDHVRGVVGKDERFDICAVAKDGARIMFARAPGVGLSARSAASKQPISMYLEVADVDNYLGQLSTKKGVNVTDQLTTQWWGVRGFKVMDPHGYEIWFYQTVGEPRPPEGTKIV